MGGRKEEKRNNLLCLLKQCSSYQRDLIFPSKHVRAQRTDFHTSSGISSCKGGEGPKLYTQVERETKYYCWYSHHRRMKATKDLGQTQRLLGWRGLVSRLPRTSWRMRIIIKQALLSTCLRILTRLQGNN